MITAIPTSAHAGWRHLWKIRRHHYEIDFQQFVDKMFEDGKGKALYGDAIAAGEVLVAPQSFSPEALYGFLWPIGCPGPARDFRNLRLDTPSRCLLTNVQKSSMPN